MNGRMVSERIRLFVSRITSPLLVGICCGVICVLVDIDHFIALPLGWNPRFLHPYYFALSCGIIVGCCTYVGGRILQKVLKRLTSR